MLQEDRRRWEGMGRPSISANFFSPSMYGSLPKALSHEERLSISRNTPASASLREVQQRTPVSVPTQNILTLQAKPAQVILYLIRSTSAMQCIPSVF